MANTYSTSQVARLIGIHPNTVRLYETLGLIPPPRRRPNGYREFTDVHIEQFKLARSALQVEVLQNGLRKKMLRTIKLSAQGDYPAAIRLAESYLEEIRLEQQRAEEALSLAEQWLDDSGGEDTRCWTRKQTAELLEVTMDTLRNWELNGLYTAKRKQNGYRVYTGQDIRLLKIIRALRCANYSLGSILRMINAVRAGTGTELREVLDTPHEADKVVYACDRLLSSLREAEQRALEVLRQLQRMKEQYMNPTL
ncbi:MerR family transcriptional regulator [Paenibacillus tengchongensis]|uniref:MerR family transcriptional regulator n=1 Tax=Paenibacillus tengchongensis TaxID=2608684 RepID=UPI00124D021E|nr:MerR family transcriptional regulator [Paenibacillus tengchongensis]